MNKEIPQNELEQKLIEIFSLLEETFNSKDSKIIKEATVKLNKIFTNLDSINLLFTALTIKTIGGKEISLALHKSVALYLKNYIKTHYYFLEIEENLHCLKHIFELIFIKSQEINNLNNHTIFNLFQDMIKYLLSGEKIKEDANYIKELFNTILTYLQKTTKENFLQISKYVILLSSSLLSSESANYSNYEQLTNDYYIPIINIIFSNVQNYLNPKNNIYNIEFITIIKLLLDGFYNNLSKMKGTISNEKLKEIVMKFFREYGTYCYELIQLMPQFDQETKNKFEKPNPIVVFNNNEKMCYEMNHMKSKAIQFFSFVTQISTLKENNKTEENNNFINDKDLQKMIMDLIALIMRTFQDILSNKEKYDFIRKYSGEVSDEDDCYNMLLFHICVFLTRSLIREPIKTELSKNIKEFLLNILFPLIVTVDDEKTFMEDDSEGYHQYINDIIFKFKNKNFRTSACFLVKKICNEFEEMNNFVLSFCMEMLNYIIKQGKIEQNSLGFNVYLKYKESAMIDQFNDKIKLDFSLLIILILNEKINQNSLLMNKFINILIENYEKIHLVPFPIIKIKICKIYFNYFQVFFEKEQKIPEIQLDNFTENVIIYLLNCIIQSDVKNKEDNIQALSYEASLTIIELMNFQKDKSESKENDNLILKNYINEKLDKNFEIIIKLIPKIDIYIFYLLLEQILSNIKITQRNAIFHCFNNLTKKFLSLYSKNTNDKDKLFFSQYFILINSLLTGENKILPENKNEISHFYEYYDPIIYFIKETQKFPYHEQLISNVEQCIKSFDIINARSILVLKNIKLILEKDSCMSLSCYNFVSTILMYLQKNKYEQRLNIEEIFKDILEIIKMSFSFTDESLKTSINYALLLTLQILNINPNLNQEVFEYLILQSFDNYSFIKEGIDIFSCSESNNQLALANISLGLIFKPEQTFQILNKKIEIEKNAEKHEMMRTEVYLDMIRGILKISYPDYYPSLGKCIMLGICSFFSNKIIQDYLKESIEFKCLLLIDFIKLALFHKNQKRLILESLMKKELNCNFIEDDKEDEEEEEEDNEEGDDELNSFIEQAINVNDNIKSSDEYEFFSKVMKNIKENDKLTYDYFAIKSKNGISTVEELSKLRNIKIKYKEKEYSVPRKTVQIIKKEHN